MDIPNEVKAILLVLALAASATLGSCLTSLSHLEKQQAKEKAEPKSCNVRVECVCVGGDAGVS
jgi:hypothetical protein